jgi:xylulose-5-phosphate/fructose-6-phosphate phosphoketolase
MMKSTKEINVMVCEKRPLPIWRTLQEARKDIEDSVSIWEFASDDNPDIVFSAAGDYPTLEALAAISLLRKHVPNLRTRFVNITSLSGLGMGHSACRVLRHDFDHYYTEKQPVIINFHGYPQTIKQVLFDYEVDAQRFSIHGYEETGSTTTPFDMMVRNRVDRFHLAMEAVAKAAALGCVKEDEAQKIIAGFQEELATHRAYAIKHGDDPVEITNWVWEQR